MTQTKSRWLGHPLDLYLPCIASSKRACQTLIRLIQSPENSPLQKNKEEGRQGGFGSWVEWKPNELLPSFLPSFWTSPVGRCRVLVGWLG